MRYCTFLFFILPVFGFSQCKDFDKLDFGGTHASKTRNHIPFDLNITDTTKYCCDIKRIQSYSEFIIAKAKGFIIGRTNETFYKRLEINQIDVNYPKSVVIAYQSPSLYNLSNFDISYWIIYTYSNDNVRYGFGLEFNKNGEMISENKFPNFENNKQAENLTDICSALNVVNNAFSGKEIDLIELAYLDSVNSFCWLLKEKPGPMECGSHVYAIDLFYVNANTNKLEMVKQQRGIETVDCFE